MKKISALVILLAISIGAYAQPGTATGKIKSSSANNPIDAAANNAKPVVETSENGTINYSAQYIEAVGSSIIDTSRFKNKAQANAMARRGAVVDAQRNLLEIIKGVHIQGETTVQDLITTSDKVVSKVEGVVKGAQMVGKPRIVDGEIEVTMRIPLYTNNGLAPAVVSELPEVPEGAKAPDTASNPGAMVTMGVKGGTASETDIAAASAANNTTKPLALRVAGKFEPSMFPVIVSENGDVLLDSKKLYDPTKGKFPKILQTGKDVAEQTGFKKGVEVLDVVQDAATGHFKIASGNKSKVNWKKIGQVAGKIGKFLLMLI